MPSVFILMAATRPTILTHSAGAAIRTADAFLAALFRLVDVAQGTSEHDCDDRNNNEIYHDQFAPLNAYLLASSLSDLLHM